MTDSRQRWRQLVLLSAAELLGMSVWFAGTAAAPELRSRLLLGASQSAWLTSTVQLGFVGGTLVAALLNLADILPLRWYVAGSALLAAMANAALLSSHSFTVALLTRALTGIALAGVYPPMMKMAATWFRNDRGLAIGAIVGALTVGKSFPYLLEEMAHLPLNALVLVPSAAAAAGGLIVAAFYREGPFPFPARPFSWSLITTVIRHPTLRMVTGGYLGHMWELYAFWAWIPTFLAASFAHDRAGASAGIWPFAAVAIGGLGSVWGGRAADRIGRLPVVRMSLVVSGACALLSVVVFGGPRWMVVVIALIWGVAVIADSAQFSALVTEEAPAHAVGTALTLQTSLGFLLTAASIQLVPLIASATGWRWAFAVLSLGPMAGLWSIRKIERLARRREATSWELGAGS